MSSEMKPHIARQGMNLSITSAIFGTMFMAGVTGPVFAALLLALNMSPVQIGIINSLAVLFIPLQVLGVLLERLRFNRKKIWITAVIGQRLAWTILILLTAVHGRFERDTFAYLFTLFFALTHLFAQLPGGLWFSWMGDLVPESKQAAYWSRRNGVAQITTVVSALVIGFTVDFWHGNLAAYLGVMAAAVALAFIEVAIHARVPDPRPQVGPLRLQQTLEVAGHLVREVLRFLREPSIFLRNYLLLAGAFGVHSLFAWLFMPFVFVYLQRDMGFSQLQVQSLTALSTVIAFFATYFYRAFGTRFGMKPVLVFCFFLKIVEFSLWTALCSPALKHWYILIFCLAGFVNIGMLIAQFTLLNQVTRPENRSLLSALFFSIQGILGFVAGNFSGVVYQALEHVAFPVGQGTFGPFQYIALMVTLSLFVSVALAMAFKDQGSPGPWAFLRLVLSQNPIRSVMHAQALEQPLTEWQRRETLSRADGSLFEKEWLAGLDSPSTWVRSETLVSLYRSGGRDGNLPTPALRERVRKLVREPVSGLQAQAILALGHIQDRDAIPDLRKAWDLALRRKDHTLLGALLVSLGRMEDPLLAPFFRDILDRNDLKDHWPAAVEALGRVGTGKDLERVLLQMNRDPMAKDPLYRKMYWLSAGRIRDKKCPLFLLFEKEERSTGSGMEDLVRKMAPDIARHLHLSDRQMDEIKAMGEPGKVLRALWGRMEALDRHRFPGWYPDFMARPRLGAVDAMGLLWFMAGILRQDFPALQRN